MALSEKAWQAQIVELAGYYRWMVFHPYSMERSEPGWPDLTLVRPPELIFAELKTNTGRLTRAQVEWGRVLTAVPGVDYFVWRPRDFDEIHKRLQNGGRVP
jgi:hypothetical protein